MRIDHIAYRVKNKKDAADFLINAFGYKIADKFQIDFEDGSCAQCYALTPPEKLDNAEDFNSWIHNTAESEYHVPPEIFISEGTPGSIVDDWVNQKGGIAAIHHIAYQVDDVAAKMKEWKEKGFAEFTTNEPITANGLTQCFTKEHPLTGTVYEFISRTTKGFNIDNVRDLMESTNKK